jgi:hypothetical protein
VALGDRRPACLADALDCRDWNDGGGVRFVPVTVALGLVRSRAALPPAGRRGVEHSWWDAEAAIAGAV